MQRITLRLEDHVHDELTAQARLAGRPTANLAAYFVILGLGITPDPESDKSPKTPELEGIAP